MMHHNHTFDRTHRHWHWHFRNTYYRFTCWRDAVFQNSAIFSSTVIIVTTLIMLLLLSKLIPAGAPDLSHNAPGWNTTLRLFLLRP